MTTGAPREAIRRKSRSLRRYEAEAVAQLEDSGPPPLKFFSPFGPMIARTTLAPALVDKINSFADRHLQPGQGRELLLPQEFVADGGDQSLARETGRAIARYVQRIEGAATRIRMDVFWIVSQYAGTPSPVHFHSGDISGVLYLKVPVIDRETEEDEKTYISGRQAGCINFIAGGRQRFSRSLISFKPRVADFYIFPGWLLHGAEPFRGTGERRSLAFNAFVETVGEPGGSG
jgi:hypothetical protein